MIIGIGIDVIDMRHLNPQTTSAVTNIHEAGHWAAKEATFKALGKGWSELGGFDSIEICNDNIGRPYIIFHSMAEEFTKGLTPHVSISHHGDTVVAMVILEESDGNNELWGYNFG